MIFCLFSFFLFAGQKNSVFFFFKFCKKPLGKLLRGKKNRCCEAKKKNRCCERVCYDVCQKSCVVCLCAAATCFYLPNVKAKNKKEHQSVRLLKSTQIFFFFFAQTNKTNKKTVHVFYLLTTNITSFQKKKKKRKKNKN